MFAFTTKYAGVLITFRVDLCCKKFNCNFSRRNGFFFFNFVMVYDAGQGRKKLFKLVSLRKIEIKCGRKKEKKVFFFPKCVTNFTNLDTNGERRIRKYNFLLRRIKNADEERTIGRWRKKKKKNFN